MPREWSSSAAPSHEPRTHLQAAPKPCRSGRRPADRCAATSCRSDGLGRVVTGYRALLQRGERGRLVLVALTQVAI
jgi:hypothetical protein